MTLSQKLERGIPLRVLFVNDLGFQFGAGIATVRQVQSFLLRGDHVMGLCSSEPPLDEHFDLNQVSITGEWLGAYAVPELGRKRLCGNAQAAERLAMHAAGAYPDVIIVGNIHSARWPVSFLDPLRAIGVPVIAYMHDCHFATGRCAYAGSCKRYQSGCDASCPTAQEYPPLAPELISGAWADRRRLFGKGGIPLVTNSHWTKQFALDGIPDARADVIHYGLDTELFSPGDKLEARRRLGLPEDAIIVLGGAVNLQEVRKGGVHLHALFQRLGRQAHGMVLGANSDGIKDAQALGPVYSQRKVRLIYRAADIFVNTSLDEAFGQMMLEAAACAVPIVAFDVGGVPDICHHNRNALLVPPGDTEQLIRAAEYFVHDSGARERFGREGRLIAVNDFSLERQAGNWTRYLREIAKAGNL